MKKSTVWIAAFAVVLCAATGAAATVMPSSELIVNGDFEAGDENTGNYTPVQAVNTVATSSYFPGWSLWNVLKARGGKFFVPSSADIGTYALVTKTESNRNNAGFHQDIVVTEPGTYKVSFTYAGRHGDSDGTDHGAQTIQVFLAPFDGDTAPRDTAEAKLVPDFSNNQLTAQYFESYKYLVPGKYRFKINTFATADRSTWFDRVSVRRIENVLVNGYFDETAVSGEYIYSHNADFSCPGWNFSTTSGLAVKNGTFIGNLPTGRTVMFVQSTSDINTSSVYQDVTIDKPGIYTLSFRHVARPSNKNTFLNQNVKVLFGRIAEEKTDLADETDLVDSFTSTQSSSWEESKLRVAALVPGTYRLKITGSSTSDKCTVFDNFRLWLDDEIVVNGEFEEGSSGQESWGAYMSYDKCRNPGWSVSQKNQVGIGNPFFGTWFAAGLDVGKYMMYIQNSGGNNNTKAWQDVHVAVPGRYTLKHNYIGRPGCTGQSLTTQMGAVLNDDIDRSRVSFSETWTVNDATTLAAFEKENFEVPAAGEYRVRFIGKNPHDDSRDIATAIDCVSLKREPNYVYWTGGGDGTTMSAPANWGVESISYADDFVFTNDAPLAVNLTADFAGATINFLGTGALTFNGIVDDGETVATNTLSVAQIYSAPSAAAALFNCPVRFLDGYDVVSRATNTFALGATATVWKRGQGAGACVLDGDFEFTADTLILDGNVTVAAGRTLRAGGLTGVNNNSITIGDNAKVILTGDLATASGATALLAVKLAETAELWATNSTALASQHFFTASRSKGTVNVGGVVLNTANHGTGLYAARINIGSGGVTCNGSANNVFMDVAGDNSVASGMTFGAFADWTWAGYDSQLHYIYKNTYVFDTLDCFDGETPRTITLAFSSDEYRDTSVIRKINPGTLVLANLNYFLGGVRVEGGIVRVSADQGSGTGPATVASGATLEAVPGGVLRNSSITVAEGGTLALADGGTLASPVSSEGEVRVSGVATITAGGSIAITGGGTLAFDEGAKIIVGSDVAAGTTLVTGAGLTAQDLAAHFETPYGAISLDGSGNVVYSSAIEWVTGGVWAEDDIYFGYANALNGGYVSNVLAAATVVGTGISRFNQAATASAAVLVDGNVHMPSGYPDYNIIYAIQQGTFTYTFASPTNIAEIAIFSRWGSGGRDGMRISDVLVQHEGSDGWQSAVPGELSIGIGSGDDHSSPGAMVAVLRRKDGLDLATGVTGVRLVFPSGQDNDGSGFAEFAAFDKVVQGLNSWTWNGNAGNTLFSDAGNWQDSSGNAAGAAGDVFAPTVKDTISISASTQVTVDTAVDVAVVRLGGGVTLENPAADAGTGAVATNTITCSAIVNAGGESVVDCTVRFIDPYNVAATNVVRFAGGATAARMGKLDAGPSRVLAGDITIAADFDVIDASADYWCVTNASRFTAGKLRKSSSADNVNGTPNFRICEGGYAHFTSITSGRDRLTVSVQGELEVDDWYDTMSVKVTKSGLTYAGDIGYPGDEAFAGSTIRAGGIRRTRYTTSSGYTDYMTYLYPANYYIGSLGIGLTYRDYSMMFTGCEKHIYAAADFSIFNYTGATPSNPADWGVYIAADTTLDTQGHTVTWTAGAVINQSSTFTKAGEGTLVMQPRDATYEGAGNAVVVAGGTLEARACTLSGAATWSSVFGGVPVTVKDGATLRIASGVTSVTNPVTLEAGATLDIQSFTSRSAEAASVGALSATGPATVRLSGTLPDSIFSTGTNFVIAASCDAASLANISLDKSGLKFATAGNCSNARLDVVDGKLVVSVKPYFYIKVR